MDRNSNAIYTQTCIIDYHYNIGSEDLVDQELDNFLWQFLILLYH